MDVYFDTDDNIADMTRERMCVCGHALIMHAFTLQYNYSTGQNYLHVTQCTSCPHDEEKWACEYFREAN